MIFIQALSARDGGGRTYIKNILKFVPEDIKVTLLTSNKFELNKKNVNQIVLNFWGRNFLLVALWDFFIAPFYILKINPTVIFYPGGLYLTYNPKKIRSIVMFRNMIPFDNDTIRNLPFYKDKLRNYVLRVLFLLSYKRADQVIFISNYGKNIISRYMNISDEKKYPLISHGVNEHFLKSNTFNPFKFKYILYPSRFSSYKHQSKVLKFYFSMPEDFRNEYKIVFIGSLDESEALNFYKVLNASGKKSKDVFILGEIPYLNLPKYYKNASLIIFASSCENCPNILLESMASGVPIIALDHPCLREFGKESISYFDFENESKFTDLVKNALHAKSLTKNSISESKKLAIKMPWNKSAKKTWELLAHCS